MAVHSKTSMLEYIRRSLEAETKSLLTESIVKYHMDALEGDFRARLKPIIEKLTLEKLETIKDMKTWQDEVHLFVHVNE